MSIYANLLKSIHDFLLGCNKTAAAKFGGQFKYLSIYQSGYFFNFRSLRSIVNILGQYEIYFFSQVMRIQYHVWIISAFAGFNVSCWKGYWDWYFADKSQICNFNPTDYLFTKSWPQHLQFGLETWNQVNVWEINTGKLNINCSIFRLFTSSPYQAKPNDLRDQILVILFQWWPLSFPLALTAGFVSPWQFLHHQIHHHNYNHHPNHHNYIERILYSPQHHIIISRFLSFVVRKQFWEASIAF